MAISGRIMVALPTATDTSHDHEYTDCDDLARFVADFSGANSFQEAGHRDG